MIPRQGYAPTPHSYVPNTSLSASINLDEEVKLTNTHAVPEAEYTEICERSLRQYKALLADETIAREFGDLEEFKAKWDLEAPRATERIRVGMPSTTIDRAPSAQTPAPAAANNTSGVLILEATQEFITFLDAVKLGLLSKDQLHPSSFRRHPIGEPCHGQRL
ncbi:Vacuolar protein-sorting-associated protein 28 [Fusarium oxysporum]|nr:Vacuolar protein-sorting-associated protein 28 [Fusarium oxysporum]